jgi:hypothetical protein
MGRYLIGSRARVKNRRHEPLVRTLLAAAIRLILIDRAYNAQEGVAALDGRQLTADG